MILSPGNCLFYFGLFLMICGNTVGVFFAALCILAGIWLWQRQDAEEYGYHDTCCQECDACPFDEDEDEQKVDLSK